MTIYWTANVMSFPLAQGAHVSNIVVVVNEKWWKNWKEKSVRHTVLSKAVELNISHGVFDSRDGYYVDRA